MKHYNWVKEEIDKLLEAGVIRNSHSSLLAPIIVVPKGDRGKRQGKRKTTTTGNKLKQG